MKRLRYLIITLFSLLMSASQAWALPYCVGDYSATAWDNCFGKLTWANGDQYVGDFKNGTSFGWGAYTSTGGRRYVGEFKYGKSNGHGTYKWPDGAKYIGYFKDNKRNGWGKFTYANGATYLGEFKGDKKNGQGTAIYVDGSKYIGEFKSNKWEGQGTHTAANGTIREGKWLSSFFQYHRKGLSINNQNTPLNLFFGKNYLAQKSDEYICSTATFSKDRKQSWTLQYRYKKHITEAKRRGLSCGVSPSSTRLALLKNDFERLSLAEREQIQSVLKALRLYYGSIDGMWGPNTQKAILKYASNNGIKNTAPYSVYPSILTNQSASSSSSGTVNNKLATRRDSNICSNATRYQNGKKSWNLSNIVTVYVAEAKRRDLSCGVNVSSAQSASFGTNAAVCGMAVTMNNSKVVWESKSKFKKYVSEAKSRGLSCGVTQSNTQTASGSSSTPQWLLTLADESVCFQASKILNGKKVWESKKSHLFKYIAEAKSRGLNCGVNTQTDLIIIQSDLESYSDLRLCYGATKTHQGITSWDERSTYSKSLITEAEKRGLSCGVTQSNTQTASGSSSTPQWLLTLADESVCFQASKILNGKKVWESKKSHLFKYIAEAKSRGLSCGVDIETKDVSEDTVVKDLSAKLNAALARVALEQRKNARDLEALKTKLAGSQKEEIKRLNAEAGVLEERNLILLAQLKLKDRERLEVEAKKLKEDQSKGDLTLKKIALIIGNYSYKNQNKLINPPNDVRELKKKLLQMGFEVTATKNLSRKKMVRALSDFGRQAQAADYALFYFSGHGIELNGNNYMIPVDATLERDDEVEYETVNLETILTKTMASKKLGIVLIDACRTNPFLAKMAYSNTTRSISRGLAKVEARENLLISFAASPGNVASDGLKGGNSPYAAALIEHLDDKKEVGMLFRKIGDTVRKLTDNVQRPMLELDLSGDEFFLSK